MILNAASPSHDWGWSLPVSVLWLLQRPISTSPPETVRAQTVSRCMELQRREKHEDSVGLEQSGFHPCKCGRKNPASPAGWMGWGAAVSAVVTSSGAQVGAKNVRILNSRAAVVDNLPIRLQSCSSFTYTGSVDRRKDSAINKMRVLELKRFSPPYKTLTLLHRRGVEWVTELTPDKIRTIYFWIPSDMYYVPCSLSIILSQICITPENKERGQSKNLDSDNYAIQILKIYNL